MTGTADAFDLNIEEVLEHWTVAHAVRELIANALDEQVLTSTAMPEIAMDDEGRWHVSDFGRGLRQEHLTQRENPEKLEHPRLIGKFGVGLKDALAVFHRRGVSIELRSPHADITIGMRAKHGFDRIFTLHALVQPASDPAMIGTDALLTGATNDDIEIAKDFFLHFSGEQVLETTKVGDILAVPRRKTPRIYVNGLFVAEEPGFLFSYNITDVSKTLRRALNRERSNVGRTAYGERVKAILTRTRSAQVVRALADDLSGFSSGEIHEELKTWQEAAVHACRALSSIDKVIFVTSFDAMGSGRQLIDYATADGLRVVVVPEAVQAKLGAQLDLAGNPMRDLVRYAKELDESFEYDFVDPADMWTKERRIFEQTDAILKLARMGSTRRLIKEVRISTTMRPDPRLAQFEGIWEPGRGRIVIKRSALRSLAAYAGTLLHEATHALSGAPDASLAFEDAFSTVTGKVAEPALQAATANVSPKADASPALGDTSR